MIFKHLYNRKTKKAGCTSKADCKRLLAYNLRQSANPQILRNDFSGENADAIADELDLLHGKQKYWIYPVVMSFAIGEGELWRPHLAAMVADAQERMGIPKGLWVIHQDKDHLHVHGALMAFLPRGRQVRLGMQDEHGPMKVAYAFRQFAQEWEDRVDGVRKTGRTPVLPDIPRDALEMARREFHEGKSTPVPEKMQLRADVQRLAHLATNFAELEQLAGDAGISVRIRRDGERVTGVSFGRGKIAIRGRDAGLSIHALNRLYENQRTRGRGQTFGMATRNSPNSSRTFETRTRKANPPYPAIAGDSTGERGGEFRHNRRTQEAAQPLMGSVMLQTLLFLFKLVSQADHGIYRSKLKPPIPL